MCCILGKRRILRDFSVRRLCRMKKQVESSCFGHVNVSLMLSGRQAGSCRPTNRQEQVECGRRTQQQASIVSFLCCDIGGWPRPDSGVKCPKEFSWIWLLHLFSRLHDSSPKASRLLKRHQYQQTPRIAGNFLSLPRCIHSCYLGAQHGWRHLEGLGSVMFVKCEAPNKKWLVQRGIHCRVLEHQGVSWHQFKQCRKENI